MTNMSNLTRVELVWMKKRIDNYVRFERVDSNPNIDRNRRVVSFTQGSIFTCVRWTANDFGTVASRIDILRAIAAGQHSTVAYVRPGADILLTAIEWPNVEKVLKIIDAIDAIGVDPIDVSPGYWRHTHSRLTAGEAPRPDKRPRHEAWLLRQRTEP